MVSVWMRNLVVASVGVFFLIAAATADPQVRVPTIPRVPGTGVPPIQVQLPNPGLGQAPGIKLQGPSLTGTLSGPSLGQTPTSGPAGPQQTSASQFVPDETSRQVQGYLDQLVKYRIQHIPAIEKTHRKRH